jgi:hypothetical protein
MFDAIAVGLYCFFVIGAAVLFLKLVARVRSRREQREYEALKREHPERVYGTDEYWARYSHPDFAAIEAHIGEPLPAELKTLYSDTETMRATEFEVVPPGVQSRARHWPVVCFFPADNQAVIDLWPSRLLGPSQLPFATDGSGGLYYLELQNSGENQLPVFYYHWDGEVRNPVAESLGEFLSWPRISSNR